MKNKNDVKRIIRSVSIFVCAELLVILYLIFIEKIKWGENDIKFLVFFTLFNLLISTATLGIKGKNELK